MLKKSASSVLASLRGSTLKKGSSEVGSNVGGFSVHQDPLQGGTAHTKCGTYLLASSLAAALPNGLIEHPRMSIRLSKIN
jgi:hypothetical protein